MSILCIFSKLGLRKHYFSNVFHGKKLYDHPVSKRNSKLLRTGIREQNNNQRFKIGTTHDSTTAMSGFTCPQFPEWHLWLQVWCPHDNCLPQVSPQVGISSVHGSVKSDEMETKIHHFIKMFLNWLFFSILIFCLQPFNQIICNVTHSLSAKVEHTESFLISFVCFSP